MSRRVRRLLGLAVVDELNALLPDRWLETHPESRLEINRATRIAGEAMEILLAVLIQSRASK